MHKTSRNKLNKRLCKYIASFLTVTLLVNQSCFSVLAEEYEEYEYIEDVADTVTAEDVENSGVSDELGTDTDANSNAESGIESDTEADMNADGSEITIPHDDEEENIIKYQISEDKAEDDIITAAENDTFNYGELTYKIINNSADNPQVEVAGPAEEKYAAKTLDIPPIVFNGADKYAVVRIGCEAFLSCYSLTNVTIPDGVTSIDYGAFEDCSRLTSIIIPDSVTSIGEGAFCDCHSLTSITIPNGVTSIAESTFNECRNLASVIIPDSVTSIGKRAFCNCHSLTSITIPNGVTKVDWFVFSGCSSLTSITIPDSVTSIELAAFSYCRSLTSITIPDSVTSIDQAAFESCSRLTSITIPDGVLSIRTESFKNCYSLENITIPDSVVRIESEAFYNCQSLTNIIIPNGVELIIHDAFKNCSNLTSITILNENIKIRENAFVNCINLCNLKIAISENINKTPFLDDVESCFKDCPTDRYLTFLTEDGTTELSNSTTPTLAEAMKAYNAVADGGIDDGYWYGWKLPEETFTITASAGTGGSVTPSGAVKVKSGDSQQFTITPKDGYRISSILADGNEVLNSEQSIYYSEAVNTKAGSNTEYYVFENVTDNHTLAAYFEPTSTGDNNGPDDSGDNDTGDNNVPDDSDVDDTDDNNAPDDSGSNNASDSSIPAVISDTNVTNNTDIISGNNPIPVSKDNEPKTGDSSYMEVYATIAMIAGLSYLLLYFADGKNGMTEEEKKEIVSALIKWAKKGKRLRKYAALAVIFLVLVYYHSIGKRTSEEWKAVYEK